MKLEKYKMGDNGLMYELGSDDVYYPLLSPPDNEIQIKFAGKYGGIARKYLETTQPFAYSFYCRTPLLQPILERVERDANDMMSTIINQLRKNIQKPVNDDFWEIVKYNYKIHDIAEEIVLNDIVYQPYIADSDFKLTINMIGFMQESN